MDFNIYCMELEIPCPATLASKKMNNVIPTQMVYANFYLANLKE